MFKVWLAALLMMSELIILAPMSATAEVASKTIAIAEFSKGSLQGWEKKEFDGTTTYEFVADKQNKKDTDQKVLKATSHDGASGLFRKIHIDLNKTPYLNWSWSTSSKLEGINESKKSGDDFVARIYVVVDGGYLFWKTIALNYVWSSSHQQGETWANPFTSNATMFAVESGDTNLGKRQHYKRNIKEDLKKLVGRDEQYIDAIAIMTDTDNSGQSASSMFGDIFFSAE